MTKKITPTKLKMHKPKIILFDIETAHNVVRMYDLFGSYNTPDAIKEERYIICASWKELGKKKINSVSVLDGGAHNDDFVVVQKLHEVLSNCDAVVGHYSDKFDMRILNSRIIYHGLPPLPPIIQIDTYKIAKSKFKFNSNRLDYLGKYLGVGRKMEVRGALWEACEAGIKSAIRKMVAYNKQDINLLDAVYEVLRPYTPAKLNRRLFNSSLVCEQCGSKHIQSRGVYTTKNRVYQRYNCQTCGHWFRGNKSIG